MSISDEDMKKFVETVKEMHEMYTKALERENEGLRNALADAQKKLDDALDVIKSKSAVEELRKKWSDMQSPTTTPWIQQPLVAPYTQPYIGSPYTPPATWGVSNGTIGYTNGTGDAMNNIPDGSNNKLSDKLSDKLDAQYAKFINNMKDIDGC